ncbi:MAG: hypothetical protein RLY40_1106 [Pseudomonadota bacterium]|jgi:hypothetical protein
MKKKFTSCFGLFLLLFSIQTLGLEQHEKLWLRVSKQQSFSENSPWLYLIFSELRFINESHPCQVGLLEGGLGRRFLCDKSIWIGYRWSGVNPNNQFYQINRLIQQLIWPIHPNNFIDLVSRSRFEEIIRGNQNQMAFRFRKRISLEMKYYFLKKINPYFYDEIFVRLNKTNFTSNSLLSQNRLFLGFRIYLPSQYLQLGYINQYQSESPLAQNRMNHILSISYNF